MDERHAIVLLSVVDGIFQAQIGHASFQRQPDVPFEIRSACDQFGMALCPCWELPI